jgi:hypothetical protein
MRLLTLLLASWLRRHQHKHHAHIAIEHDRETVR